MILERDQGSVQSNETSPAGRRGRQTHMNKLPHSDNKPPRSSTCHSSSGLVLISPLLIYFQFADHYGHTSVG